MNKQIRVTLFLTAGLGDNILALPLAAELLRLGRLRVVAGDKSSAGFFGAALKGAEVADASSFVSFLKAAAAAASSDFLVYPVASCARRYRLINLLAPFSTAIGFTTLSPEKAWQAEIGFKYCMTPDLGRRAWINNLRLLELMPAGDASRPRLKYDWDFYVAAVSANIPPDEKLSQKYPAGTAIHPGSNKYPGNLERYKRWPQKRFEELAASLAKDFPGENFYWIIGPGEENLVPDRAAASNLRVVVCREVFGGDIIKLYNFLRGMKYFIGNDTGIAHLAALAGVPMTTITSGISQVHYTAQDGSRTRLIWEDVACRGCTVGISAVLAVKFACPNGWACMENITVGRVRDAVFSEMGKYSIGKERI